MIDEALQPLRHQRLHESCIASENCCRRSDQIVMVAVSSAHRGQAFQACEFLMDYLKTQAPFWKKEHTPEGARWVDARSSERRRSRSALGRVDAVATARRAVSIAVAVAGKCWPCRSARRSAALSRWLSGLWLNAPSGPASRSARCSSTCVGGLLIGLALAWFERTPNELLAATARYRLAAAGSRPSRRFRASRSCCCSAAKFAARVRPHGVAHLLGSLSCAALGFWADACGAGLIRDQGRAFRAPLENRAHSPHVSRNRRNFPHADRQAHHQVSRGAGGRPKRRRRRTTTRTWSRGIVLSAMLAQADGPKALLDRAGANTAALKTSLDVA